MQKFVDTTTISIPDQELTSLEKSNVEKIIHQYLESIPTIMNDDDTILRLAGPDDVDDIARLVKELAIYEKEPDGVHVTSENYRVDGCSEEPIFYCLMVDFKDAESNNCKNLWNGTFLLRLYCRWRTILIFGRFIH